MDNSDYIGIERRSIPSRRQEDIELFSSCPKYIRHDLTEEQVVEIAKKAVILYKEEQEREIGRLTKKGFIYILGALVTGAYIWAVSNGFIIISSK